MSTNVRAVERTFTILCAFSGERSELTLEQIAQAAELPRSTTHRLLQTLISCDVVERGRRYGGYRLSLRLASIGSAALSDRQPAEEIHQLLLGLRDKLGETVSLSTLDRDAAVVLARVVSLHAMPVNIQPGTRVPGHGSASGKALLSCLTDHELDELYGDAVLSPLTTHTITTLPELKAEVGAIRQQGYAIDEHEFAIGVCCIAVPVRVSEERSPYALGMSGSSARLSRESLLTHLDELRAQAERIEAHLAPFPDSALASVDPSQ